MDHRDFKETVTRPFHIQNRTTSEEYRSGWDRIWGRKVQDLEESDTPPRVESEQSNDHR
jgi:hypothetical protein